MKNKSSHHQSQNTFKFQTFSERLSAINIDVICKFGKFSTKPEDADTFFGEALMRWSDINLTQHFIDFHREISRNVLSLPQLIHHKKEIVDALEKHLRIKDSLAIQPLLDLLIQLARDLQGDFYPYFEQFFHTLVWLLNTYHHNVEILEQTFTCLAYLFKFLWRHMLKNINHIFGLFSPLLGSQYKEYIHIFAAESFAFLMRKHKDPSALFDFMFSSLDDNKEMTHGVGQLLFEMIKGVKHQFHSSFEKVLPLLLEKLGEKTLPQEKVHEVMVTMFHSIASHTVTEHCEPLWHMLLQAVRDVHKCLKMSKAKNRICRVKHLNSLLLLIHVMIFRRHGLLVCCQDQLVQVLCELLQSDIIPETSVAILLKVISSLILAERCQLASHHRPHIVNLIYKSNLPTHVVFEFTSSMFDADLFEKDLLPGLLDYCQRYIHTSDDISVLVMLTKLVQHKIPPTTGISDPTDMTVYTLDFSISMQRTGDLSKPFSLWLLEKLKQHCSPKKEKDFSELWALLSCVPHVRPLDPAEFVPCLLKLYEHLKRHLIEDCTGTSDVNQYLHILQQVVTASYQLFENKEEFFEQLKPESIMSVFNCYSQNIDCLKMCDVYLTAAKHEAGHILNQNLFYQLFDKLQYNFSSPFSQVRLLSSHLLCLFSLEMPPVPQDSNIEQMGIFQICLEAEGIPATVQTYREKLRLLQKLSHDVVSYQLPVGPFEEIPLRYLCGMLYINMTLLWKPVLELIATHAVGLSRQQFWLVWSDLLLTAADKAEEERQKVLEENAEISRSETDLHDLFISHLQTISTKSDRPDYINFRDNLWKAMQLFPEVCEPKSRIISPLLFRFLENEYYPSDFNLAPTQDISINKKLDTLVEEDMELSQEVDISQSLIESENMDTSQLETVSETAADQSAQTHSDNDVTMQSESIKADTETYAKASEPESSNAKRKTKRATNKTFADHLSLFTKFKDPKSLYLEPKLRQLYFQLLQHRDANLQKIAFDCIMTYNFDYLMPYRENFKRLMDDKTFKNEIILFSIDETVTVVKAEHRKDLLAVLFRILYGKMQSKTGRDSSGRGSGQFRKNIILKFLGGSKQDEVNSFLDMVFEPLKDYLTGSIGDKVKHVMKTADPTKVIPLKKLQGILNTIDLVIHKLGSLLEGYLPNIIQLVCCIGGLCTALLARRDELNPKAVNSVKNIRNAAICEIIQFYERFDYYEFSKEETEVIFDVAVWPLLEKLPYDGCQTPTPLLKLFRSWAENARFFPLFAMVHPENAELTPLPYIFKLLQAKHVKAPVLNMVTDIIQCLLDADNSEETPLDQSEDDHPYGIKLLLPHVSTILLHLKNTVCQLGNATGKKNLIPTRELNILSRLSEYVTDKSESTEVVRLLLPFLGQHITRPEQVEVDILTTISHLIHQTEQPDQFLIPLSKLFSIISQRNSREKLCDVLKTIAEDVPVTKKLAEIVYKINSWDKRRLDEPDYMLRLEGFEEAQKLIDHSPDASVMLTLLNNCCFFITTTTDMSLRDSASFCIEKIIEKLATFSADCKLFRLVVAHNLLPEIKDKLKHKQEIVRNDFINILASLTRHFPSYGLFAEMIHLTDKEDSEVDFFNNIVHIQQHRRARALRRLVRILGTRTFSASTLMSYLLPMTTMFIKDQSYAKAINLHDASVEATGAICKQLPWQHYLVVLRFYLAYLTRAAENQKLAVRLIVAVLDAFHFDLRNSLGVKTALLASEDDLKVKEGPAMDTDPADPERISITEEQNTKLEEGKTKAQGTNVENEADLVPDDDTSDEDNNSPAIPGVIQICSVGLATKIDKCISKVIIPQLHKALTQKAKSDDEHKKAHKRVYPEDEEILRVPLALAMVKLLQHLPAGRLEFNLPGILIKVCQFLKSRSDSIREPARDTINKILQSLGAKYFYFLVKELQATLKRGYQMHVLCYTIWSLMKNLSEDKLCPGDFDHCIPMLVEIFNEELFGELAEEKEVDAITKKLFEAKSSKSYDSYGIMAKYISRYSLASLIKPLVQVLETSNSHKKAKKVSDVLYKICFGLIENTGLELSYLMTFLFGLTTETLPHLFIRKKEPVKDVEKPGIRPPSTYLLHKEPKRGGVKPKSNPKTNMYIVVEFGLQVLNQLLKKSMLNPKEKQHLELLDPFVSPLTKCLSSKHIKVVTVSLRCLLWLFKFPLPSLKDNIETITNTLFVLLSNYAAPGTAHGENIEMIMICFKTLTVLVRDVHYHTLSSEQLQVLLGYAEEDIHDFSRQATAFTILKAILSRKLVCPDMPVVMKKIQELSIVSETPHIRLQCRQVVMQYLLDYPLGKKLQHHLEFYVKHLEYKHEAGRESALEMLAKIFSEFPQVILARYSGLFFLPLASRLINDQSAHCQKLTSLAIKTLLSKLDSSERDNLFNICTEWLKSPKAPVRKLAAKACGIFVEVESSGFQRHLDALLPLLEEEIHPDKYPDETYSEKDNRDNDRHLFVMLSLIMKLLRECDVIRNPSRIPVMNKIWEHIQGHLLYPHSWVRLCSSQLFGLLFSSYTPDELVEAGRKLTKEKPLKQKKSQTNEEKCIQEYLLDNFQSKLYQLCGIFCKQLASPVLEQDLADQVIKNLVFLAKILKLLPENNAITKDNTTVDDVDDETCPKADEINVENDDTNKIASFRWLIKRMCREARIEASLNPKHIIKRQNVFKWLAAVAIDLGVNDIHPYLSTILQPLVREITDSSSVASPALKQLSQEVLDLIKSIVGVQSFTKEYATVQNAFSQKRATRKRERALELVTNPELAARRKIKKQLAKRETRKRRIERSNPFKKLKRAKHT